MSVSSNLIVIDSKSRASGTSQSFKFNFAETFEAGTYLFTSFSMTNNLYNVVEDENDKIYMTHSVDGANTLTITPGHYTAATLLTEVVTQLDTISAVTYGTSSYSSSTGKYTFIPNSGNINFDFASNTAATSRYILGLNAEDGTPASQIVSDNPIDLKLHDNIALSVSQDNSQHGTLPGGTEFSVLIPLENSVSFGEVIHYKHQVNYSQYMSFSSSIQQIEVSLLAGDGDALPNNDAEFCFTIKKIF